MYTGNEHFISNSECLSYSLADFWKWAYSKIIDNTTRGMLTEYIVKTALDNGGYPCNKYKEAWTPYDLDGPPLSRLSSQRTARIEVKSASYVQSWGKSKRISFNIAPTVIWREETRGAHHNNDIYVFALYTSNDEKCDILDLSLWKFYVVPTFQIEADPELRKQKTISLNSVCSLCAPSNYEELCAAIIHACDLITIDILQTEPDK